MHAPRRTSLALGSALLLSALPAAAQVPRLLGYQGRLLRSDGTAATGTATLGFAIFDAATGGSALWNETQTLGLSDGYYSTLLGLVSTPADSVFDAGPRWVQVSVGSETLSPRQQIGAVSYALTARSVAGGAADVAFLRVGGQTVVDAAGRLAGAARYSAGPGIAIDAGQTVSLQACAPGQALVRDATGWQCATAGTVTAVGASGPLSVGNSNTTPQLSMTQAAANAAGYLSSTDWALFAGKLDASTQCGGDLAGYLPSPVVTHLQSRPVAAAAPSDGQVLKWNGVQWAPAADANSGGTVTGLVGHAPLAVWNGSTTPEISLGAAGATSDGFLSSSDWARFGAKYDSDTVCGGDLQGTFLSPQVARIQGVSVASAVPSASQVLRFDGTRWAPASLGIADVGGISTGYLDLTGAQTIGGAKNFTAAPSFGSPLGTASGGTGTTTAEAGTVFAGPAGSSGAPSFRALASGDIPALDVSKITGGTLGVARGGTGTSAEFAPGGVLYAGASGVYSADAARLAWDNANARLGIGTGSPGYGLDVQGGQVNASGGLCIAGDCKSAWTQIGYWSLNNGNAYSNHGGNVGLGTTVPTAARLVVEGVDRTPLVLGRSNGGDEQLAVTFDHSLAGQSATWAFQRNSGTSPIAYAFSPDGGGSYNMVVQANGRVGIGTTAPASVLEVRGGTSPGGVFTAAGSSAVESALTLSNTTAGSLALHAYGSTGAGVHYWTFDSARTNSVYSTEPLYVITAANKDLHLSPGESPKVVVKSTGNVGVGTTNPTNKLQVAGDVGASALVLASNSDSGACALGSIRFNGTTFQGCTAAGWTNLLGMTPTLTTIAPGTAQVGETVTLTGSNFSSPATVTIGSTAATSPTVVSATSMTAVVPTMTAGTYDIVVSNGDFRTATKTAALVVVPPGRRYYRLTLQQATGSATTQPQVSELQIFDQNTNAFVVNDMTDFTVPSPKVVTVTAPTCGSCYVYSNTAGWRVFNGVNATSSYTEGILTYGVPFSVTIDFGATNRVRASKYRIWTSSYSDGGGQYRPVKWYMESSNDGSTWTTIDTYNDPANGVPWGSYLERTCNPIP